MWGYHGVHWSGEKEEEVVVVVVEEEEEEEEEEGEEEEERRTSATMLRVGVLALRIETGILLHCDTLQAWHKACVILVVRTPTGYKRTEKLFII